MAQFKMGNYGEFEPSSTSISSRKTKKYKVDEGVGLRPTGQGLIQNYTSQGAVDSPGLQRVVTGGNINTTPDMDFSSSTRHVTTGVSKKMRKKIDDAAKSIMEFDPSFHPEEAEVMARETIKRDIAIRKDIKRVRRVYEELFGVAKKSLYTEVIYRVFKKIFQLETKHVVSDAVKASLKHRTKEIGKILSKQNAKSLVKGTAQVVGSIRPTIEIDTSRFDAAMKEYVKLSKRSFVDICNGKAFNIAIKSIRYTYKAASSDIRSSLRTPSKINPRMTVAEMKVISDYRKQGVKPTKQQIAEGVKAMTGARTKAAGFLRSGWLPAIHLLARTLPTGGRDRGKPKGKDKGGAIPATPFGSLINTESVIFNAIQAGGDQNAHKYMLDGLQSAFNEEAASMELRIKRDMERNAAKINRG